MEYISTPFYVVIEYIDDKWWDHETLTISSETFVMFIGV